MDKDHENNLRCAIAGERVSRRWLLKSTATFAAGTVAISALGASTAGEAETPTRGGSRQPASQAMIDIWDRF